jgi:hypothetical protein
MLCVGRGNWQGHGLDRLLGGARLRGFGYRRLLVRGRLHREEAACMGEGTHTEVGSIGAEDLLRIFCVSEERLTMGEG